MRTFLAFVIQVTLFAIFPPKFPPQSVEPPTSTTKLVTPELVESSGVAVDKSGTIWSHNDSGGRPRVFGFEPEKGTLKTTLLLESRQGKAGEQKELRAVDWEDICAFHYKGAEFLAIGDVGDNLSKRKNVQVHFLHLAPYDAPSSIRAVHTCTAVIRYPERPVNCEAICFDPISKSLLLPSKETFRCQIFGVDLKELVLLPKSSANEDTSRSGRRQPHPKASETAEFELTAKLLGVSPVPMVTGADISRNGQHLVMCTYGPGAWIERSKQGSWALADPRLFRLPYRKQGEAICFTPAGKSLLLTSEFAPTPLLKLDIQQLEFAK